MKFSTENILKHPELAGMLQYHVYSDTHTQMFENAFGIFRTESGFKLVNGHVEQKYIINNLCNVFLNNIIEIEQYSLPSECRIYDNAFETIVKQQMNKTAKYTPTLPGMVFMVSSIVQQEIRNIFNQLVYASKEKFKLCILEQIKILDGKITEIKNEQDVLYELTHKI